MDMRPINGCRSTQDRTKRPNERRLPPSLPSSRLPLPLSLALSVCLRLLSFRPSRENRFAVLEDNGNIGTAQKLKKKETITLKYQYPIHNDMHFE